MGQNESPPAQNALKTLVRASQMAQEQIWKKSFSSPWGPWWAHRWPRARRGLPSSSTNRPVVRVLGVSLGNCEAWKPQKLGGGGWTRCHWNLEFSHVAQDTARSWFWGNLTNVARNPGHFGAVSRMYWGVKGQQTAVCHRAIEAHIECSNYFPWFGRFVWVAGPFWSQKGCFGAQNAQFWEVPDWVPPPRDTTGEFLAENLDLARAPPPRV